MPNPPTSLTPQERRRRSRLVAQGAKQTLAADRYQDGNELVDDGLDNEIARIDKRGHERWLEEADEHRAGVKAARRETAAAKVTLRAAKGDEKRAARQALREAKDREGRAEREARKHGVRI